MGRGRRGKEKGRMERKEGENEKGRGVEKGRREGERKGVERKEGEKEKGRRVERKEGEKEKGRGVEKMGRKRMARKKRMCMCARV